MSILVVNRNPITITVEKENNSALIKATDGMTTGYIARISSGILYLLIDQAPELSKLGFKLKGKSIKIG